MAPYFLVAWISWSCLGGWVKTERIPAAGRPILCDPQPETERIAGREAAIRRVRELGPEARTTLDWCRGLKCWSKPVKWWGVLEEIP